MKLLRFLLLLVSVVPFGLGGARSLHAEEMGFGLVGVQARQEMEESWAPLLAGLSRQLGVTVHPDVAKDYAAAVWAMHNGKDQFVWTGNKMAIEAVDNADAEVFAQLMFAPGQHGYTSDLIVAAHSPFGDPAQLIAQAKTLTLGMGDLNSTSGYVVPRATLFARGSDPERSFLRVVHDSHEGNIAGVVAGRLDAAVVASVQIDHFILIHPEAASAIKVIWRSPLIPSDPLLWTRSLPEETRRKALAFFIGYGLDKPGKPADQLAEERATLRQLGIAGFIASDDSQLLPVRRVELFGQRLRVASDTGLAAAEKDRRLAEIDRKLGELDRHPLPSN